MSDELGRLSIIGAGAMGSAFAQGVISRGLYRPEDITLADVDSAKLSQASSTLGASVTADNAVAVEGARVVLLAVKPSVVPVVLNQIKDKLTADQLLISIAAGVRIAFIESRLLPQSKVIRAMPNTPCRIGQGAIAYACGSAIDNHDIELAERILGAVGVALQVPEELMNAVTGLSGSGPAYVFVMIDALADAGVRVGLSRETALKLAAQTVMGSARMILETGERPAILKEQVTSPGGTTICGLEALERGGFRSALIEAVKAATKRADELG